MEQKRTKGRFAPSPTGRMHLGNAYSALLSWLSARSQGGTWLLRIEDLDPQRSRLDYARWIEDDLQWLGLPWDEGGLAQGCRQSLRGEAYSESLARLTAMTDAAGHAMVYPCYCSRADILATQAPHESDGRVVYKGTCRPENWKTHQPHPLTPLHRGEGSEMKTTDGDATANKCPLSTLYAPLLEGEGSGGEAGGSLRASSPSLRLRVPDEAITFTDGHYGVQTVNLARQCGDFILRRSDGAWAYQLAVVVDDAAMGVTEVVRGRDLLLSVPQQLYLYRLLGLREPRFCHLPLLCNTAGQRLSKRDMSLDMGHLRQHHTAAEVIGWLAGMAGLISSPEPLMPADLIPCFSWDKVPLADITVSWQ